MTRIRQCDQTLFDQIKRRLKAFDNSIRPLPGIDSQDALECFANQIIDSVRRVRFVQVIRDKEIDEEIADPSNGNFDPIKGASWHRRSGGHDEACWLVYLSTLFGKHYSTGWNLLRSVYGGLGQGNVWNWQTASHNPRVFEHWIIENAAALKASGKFGNHRKFESLKAGYTPRSIVSYIEWVGPTRNHSSLINNVNDEVLNDPKALFSHLYSSMNAVHRFGRLGMFDYLTMLGKLGLFEIEPASTNARWSTGPLDGARLLFGTDGESPRELEAWLDELAEYLQLYFDMQVMEDAVCNWQKRPTQYQYFGG